MRDVGFGIKLPLQERGGAKKLLCMGVVRPRKLPPGPEFIML
jgi:hypothetical protein